MVKFNEISEPFRTAKMLNAYIAGQAAQCAVEAWLKTVSAEPEEVLKKFIELFNIAYDQQTSSDESKKS